MNEILKTYASSEAKNFASESIEVIHLFLAAVKILDAREMLDHKSRVTEIVREIHQLETQRDNRGFKTPEFTTASNSVLAGLNSVSDLLAFVKNFQLGNENAPASPPYSEKASRESFATAIKAGGFHTIAGPNLSRLTKYMPVKEVAEVVISNFLVKGENYIWDGVYNSKGYPISTRMNTQSMGRLFVTNLRLIFWSDDLDKPHLGVLYSDIDSWKTNWLPMKSRGVAMVVSSKKVLFAANSTAIDFATKEYLKVKE